jgi:hypothetical protein
LRSQCGSQSAISVRCHDLPNEHRNFNNSNAISNSESYGYLYNLLILYDTTLFRAFIIRSIKDELVAVISIKPEWF